MHVVVCVEFVVFWMVCVCVVNIYCAWCVLMDVAFAWFKVNFEGSGIVMKVCVGCSVG